MEGNKYMRLNPQKCEQLLSSFGKKVLHELVKQWNKAPNKTNSSNRRYTHSPTKKILNFNDDSLHNTSSTTPALPPQIQIYSTEEPFNLHVVNNVPPEIQTSEDLLINTLDICKNKNNDSFVNPFVMSRNIVHEAISDGKNDHPTFKKVNVTVENHYRTETSDVNWDNMFDSELLDAVAGNNGANTNLNVSDTIYPKERVSPSFNENNDRKCEKKRQNINTVNSNNNTKKARKQEYNPDEPPKSSTTIINVPKINLRKQKYTKTVKNWLNDVEIHNPINEDINMEYISNIINDNETPRAVIRSERDTTSNSGLNNNIPKIIIEKSVKSNKKVVQAQLANKDGVMKYTKPRNETKETKNDTDLKVVKNKKDKITKKFVPPRSTPTPVEEITYEVLTVTDKNIDEYFENINFGQDTEIIAVLIYSNGFSQLNCHFTDDTCTANSLLLGIGDVFYCFKGAGQKLIEALALVLETYTVICYEARSVFIYLKSQQMKIKAINIYDVKIGASLLDPDNSPENFSDLQKLLGSTAPYTIATECPLQKACWYTTLLKKCWIQLQEKLSENQLWHVFVEIEMKLSPIIAEMEYRGILIDLSKLKSMEEILLTRMRLTEQKCYKAAGKEFQINSAVQVRAILYDELQLDSKCNVKIKETLSGGLKSTSEAMLRGLMSVHELPKLILEYRHLHKAHATFLAGIAQHVKDNVVRPTWLQTAAATGRIASSNPNLQAIPKVPFSLAMFPDEDNTASGAPAPALKFRSPYVARAGRRLLAADFQHVECRVFAHLAADKALAHALAHSIDLFTVLAAHWLNKAAEAVSAVERERTKRLVYASLYGAGTRKLMEILDVPYDQALQVAASFNRTFPSLKSFGRQVVAQCRSAGGRLATLCGRVRRVNDIGSDDVSLRAHAERQAVNFVVQGSAADLCKLAMVQTQQQLEPLQAHLLLQLHDELVWEVETTHVPEAAGIIKRVMEGVGTQCGMAMLLPVAISVGDNWGDMEPYAVPT